MITLEKDIETDELNAVALEHGYRYMRLFRFEIISSFAMTLLLGVCGMLCSCGAPQTHQVANLPMSSKLILRDVTVVDTHDGSLSPHMDIMMDRGKIVGIAPTGISASSASARTIDAPGKFVVPGYLDMHAHVLGTKQTSEMLTLMLANGITGFRQMSGSSDLLAERKNGTLPISGVAPELLAMPGTILTPLNAGSPQRNVDANACQRLFSNTGNVH